MRPTSATTARSAAASPAPVEPGIEEKCAKAATAPLIRPPRDVEIGWQPTFTYTPNEMVGRVASRLESGRGVRRSMAHADAFGVGADGERHVLGDARAANSIIRGPETAMSSGTFG